MAVHPTSLGLKGGNQLLITWSDGQTREYSARDLRAACPCATCREVREENERKAQLGPNAGAPAGTSTSSGGMLNLALPVITPQEARPLAIEDMRPVGSYAYAIAFSDGHNTGIFTLDFLRELGTEVAGT